MDLTASVRDVGRATMTTATPRLDAVCMLLFRFWFRLVKSDPTVNLYLFSGRSLEWKGRELHASSIDLVYVRPLGSGAPTRLARAECFREAECNGLEMLLDGRAFSLHVAVVLQFCAHYTFPPGNQFE